MNQPLSFFNLYGHGAAVLQCGRVLGVVPKTYLPTYREFYERRQFAPGE